MVKFDVKNAYLNVAIHHRDRPLLGMWCDKYYGGMALPIYIFTANADTANANASQQMHTDQWMATHNHGTDFPRYYLDYFFLP